jgi:hypothetical protein
MSRFVNRYVTCITNPKFMWVCWRYVGSGYVRRKVEIGHEMGWNIWQNIGETGFRFKLFYCLWQFTFRNIWCNVTFMFWKLLCFVPSRFDQLGYITLKSRHFYIGFCFVSFSSNKVNNSVGTMDEWFLRPWLEHNSWSTHFILYMYNCSEFHTSLQ